MRHRVKQLLQDAEQARQQEVLLEAAGEEVLQRTRMLSQAIEKRVKRLTETEWLESFGRENVREVSAHHLRPELG